MRRNLLFLSLVIFLGSILGGAGAAQKVKNSRTPVRTIMQGLGLDTVPTYRLQSDQGGPYTSYANGPDVVVSELDLLGDWVLELNNSATRKVLLDVREPAPGGAPVELPPFEHAEVSARLISKCASLGNDLRALLPGSVIYCPLSIAFDYNGKSYAVRMNGNFEGTTLAAWSCLNVDGAGKCNQWRLEPGGVVGEEKKNIGQFVRLESSRGRLVNIDLGRYYISFQVDVVK